MAKIIFIINILSILVMTWALVQAETFPEEELQEIVAVAMERELNRSAEILKKNDFTYEENSFGLIRCHKIDLGFSDDVTGYHCEAQTKRATWHNQMVTGTFSIDLRIIPKQKDMGKSYFGPMIVRSKDGDQVHEFDLPRYDFV